MFNFNITLFFINLQKFLCLFQCWMKINAGMCYKLAKSPEPVLTRTQFLWSATAILQGRRSPHLSLIAMKVAMSKLSLWAELCILQLLPASLWPITPALLRFACIQWAFPHCSGEQRSPGFRLLILLPMLLSSGPGWCSKEDFPDVNQWQL